MGHALGIGPRGCGGCGGRDGSVESGPAGPRMHWHAKVVDAGLAKTFLGMGRGVSRCLAPDPDYKQLKTVL